MKKGNTTLIITEKPQAAAKIAEALSNSNEDKRTSKNGVNYFEFSREGKKYVVGCAVGHLYGVQQREARGPFPNFDVEWKPSYMRKSGDFTKRYLDTLKVLTKEADEVIVATDFDVEGEVIGWNVVRFVCEKKDAKRMKFSSLTNEALNESFQNMMPTLNWGAALAGETRHYLDWYYGINLSRGLMKAITAAGAFRILSIGRVQGPALKILNDREIEIEKFKPETYWQIFLQVKDIKNQKLEVKHPKDIFKESELLKFKHLKGKKGIAETTLRENEVKPPVPFDLTTLQTEGYKNFGYTPSQTLKIAQRLYLAGLISYPRTSSQKYPAGTDFSKILRNLDKFTTLTKYAINKFPIQGNKEDPAHPAISPTGEIKKITESDRKLYTLIAKRFIAGFAENAKLENKHVKVTVNDLDFTANGTKILKEGWMAVYPHSTQEEDVVTMNGEVDVLEIRTEEKQTKPTGRYSAASLVKELEKRGLGTKATRASIVETLYSRGYVKEKSIEVTELGQKMVKALDKYAPIILDEKLTKEMGDELEEIETSGKDLEKKKEKILEREKKVVTDIANDMTKHLEAIGKELADANEAVIEAEREDNTMTTCPVCKEGRLRVMFGKRFHRYFVSCNAYPKCKTIYSLPPRGMMKPVRDKEGNLELCAECKFPLVLSLQKGRAPWKICFNTKCPSNKEREEKKEEFKKKLASGEIEVDASGKFVDHTVEKVEKTEKVIRGKKDSQGKFVGTKRIVRAKGYKRKAKKVVSEEEENSVS